VIENFKHKGLREFFDYEDRRRLPPPLVERIRDILTALDAARDVLELSRPTFRLHPLRGNLKGFWAVTVRANWRIIPIRGWSGIRCRSRRLSLRTKLMPMKYPSHPGRLIKADLEELGISIAEAAEGLGITRQQLYRVINGTSAVSAEMAVRLEKAIGSTADMWLRMQMNYDLAQLRNRSPAIRVKRLTRKVA
jgi:addiction module HigA family antidote